MKSIILCLFAIALLSHTAAADDSWPRHTIDASSQGADGVRLADADGDGRLDVVTGWEEGGVVRVYRQPGADRVRQPWPAVTVGRVQSPEDAVFVDLNNDGVLDVLSCCEGKTRTVFWHRAPAGRDRYWNEADWTTHSLSGTVDLQQWMFCLVLESVPNHRMLIAGSKGGNAAISRLAVDVGLLPRDRDSAVVCGVLRLGDAGWIMSLRGVDMDGDGDRDVLYSDRKGPHRGVGWLENPNEATLNQWHRHVLGGTNEEVMFLDVGDLTGDGTDEIAVATRTSGLIVFRRDAAADGWTAHVVPMPSDCGTGKGVAIGDVDQNGRADLVVSCENAHDKHGVFWLSSENDEGPWTMHPISGTTQGIKFDRLELLDLDADGDLDVMTCEERDNLGVIWYENPTR